MPAGLVERVEADTERRIRRDESTVEVSQTEQLQVQQVLMVAKAMVRAEQEELLRLRDEEGLPDAVVRSIMTKLDLRAQTLAAGRL